MTNIPSVSNSSPVGKFAEILNRTKDKTLSLEDGIANVGSSVGVLSALKTNSKGSAVSAINELFDMIGSSISDTHEFVLVSVGNTADLETENKTNFVAAINEIDSIAKSFDFSQVTARVLKTGDTMTGNIAFESESPVGISFSGTDHSIKSSIFGLLNGNIQVRTGLLGAAKAFTFNVNGNFSVPGRISAGAASIDSNGNIVGSAWNTFGGSTDAITAIATNLSGKANSIHSHAMSHVTGLSTALSGKSSVGHTHPISDIINLTTSLAGKANITHTHLLSDITNAGSMASQNSNSVSISGGSVTGITDLAVADGGTGASDAYSARTNLQAQKDLTYISIVELGVSLTGDRVVGIDFHACDSGNSYESRISRSSGPDGNLNILQTGSGNINIWTTNTGGIIYMKAATGFNLDTTGYATINGNAIRTGTVAVANGGTGGTTQAEARTNLGLVIGTDVQAYDTNTAKLNVAQTWSSPQRSIQATATSGTTITLDMAAAQDWILTLSHNATLANPTNQSTRLGQKGSITCVQDGTGGRTLSYDSKWFPIGSSTAPSVPTAANSKFRIDYHVVSSSRIDFIMQKVGS